MSGSGTVNSQNEDVSQVATALADARHAKGLSGPYYRKADDALARLETSLGEARAANTRLTEELREAQTRLARYKKAVTERLEEAESECERLAAENAGLRLLTAKDYPTCPPEPRTEAMLAAWELAMAVHEHEVRYGGSPPSTAEERDDG